MRSLKELFNLKVLSLGAVAAAFSFSMVAAYKTGLWDAMTLPGEPLTEGEKALARSVFGDGLDYKDIRKHYSPADKGVAGRAVGNHIIFYTEANKSQDYSKDENVFNYGMFVHEMTHIWQMTNLFSQTNFYCAETYRYELEAGRSFESYCYEQQAAMVEDYARRFLYHVAKPSNYYKSFHKDDTPESDALLIETVEGAFPAVRAARLRVAAQRDEAVGLLPQLIRP